MINKWELAKRILSDLEVNPKRLALEWVSAAEAPRFVEVITEFTERISNLGPLGSSEGLDTHHLHIKLKAAKMALEGKKVRMVFARQAKYKKHDGGYRDLPDDHKLNSDLTKALEGEVMANRIILYLHDSPRNVEELVGLLHASEEDVVQCFRKLEKKGLVEPDRLIQG